MAERSIMFMLLYKTTELNRLSTARSCESKMPALLGAKSPGESKIRTVSCAKTLQRERLRRGIRFNTAEGSQDINPCKNNNLRPSLVSYFGLLSLLTSESVAQGGTITIETSSVSGLTVSPTCEIRRRIKSGFSCRNVEVSFETGYRFSP